MTLRVAITGVGGDVGRGAIMGLRRNPREEEPIYLLGLDGVPYPSNPRWLDRFVHLPMVGDDGYIDSLVSALQHHEIDVLLPGIDSEIALLSAAQGRLATAGTKVVLAPDELVAAADDKLITERYLTSLGVKVPATQDAGAPLEIDFPLVAKPRQGHGSQWVTILEDQEELRVFLEGQPVDFCLQRHIAGPEITVGFLYDSSGVLRDAIAMERTLENGRTVRARVLDDAGIIGFMDDFGTKVSGIGAINAQLRWNEHEGPMVFEINARLSGSTEMRVAVGFNDPLRLARHFGRGVPIPRATPQRATIRRSGAELVVEPC